MIASPLVTALRVSPGTPRDTPVALARGRRIAIRYRIPSPDVRERGPEAGGVPVARRLPIPGVLVVLELVVVVDSQADFPSAIDAHEDRALDRCRQVHDARATRGRELDLIGLPTAGERREWGWGGGEWGSFRWKAPQAR